MRGSVYSGGKPFTAPYFNEYTHPYSNAQVSSSDEGERAYILGQRIAEERTRKGLSQAQLTLAVTGTARAATSSDWESGKRVPDALTLGKLAEVLGVTADSLLHGAKEPAAQIEGRASAEPIGNVERLELIGMLNDVQRAITRGRGGQVTRDGWAAFDRAFAQHLSTEAAADVKGEEQAG